MDVTHFSDPACPWAYSASPVLAALRWRYGDQLQWRLVMIGLREEAGPLRPVAAPQDWAFARFGMPYTAPRRTRGMATGRACRAVVAARAQGREHDVHRALQLAWFTTDLLLDTDDGIAAALCDVEALDAQAVVAALDTPATEQAYQRDRDETRSAAGGAAEAQERATVAEDGRVRFTAPSLIFDGRLQAGGFQPLQAYDICVANLAPGLERRPAAADPLEALAAFPDGLATAEVAAIMAPRNTPPDLDGTAAALHELTAAGRVQSSGPLWRAAGG